MTNRLDTKKTFRNLALSFLTSATLFLAGCGDNSSSENENSDNETNSIQTLEQSARNAYIYGFPIVENYNFLSDHLSDSATKNVNEFTHKSQLLTSDDRELPLPNNDSLNSSIVFDLRAQPIVIRIPEILDRYFSIQLINIVTENMEILFSESEGADEKEILLVSPNWDNTSFENSEEFEIIRADSDILVGFMRIGIDSTDDLENARSIQSQVSVESLSDYRMLPAPDFEDPINWPPAFNAKTTTDLEFFDYLNLLLQLHELDDDDQTALSDFAALGISPGASFDDLELNSSELDAISRGVSAAQQDIRLPSGFSRREGWNQVIPTIGTYGNDYILRSVIAWYGLYAMSPTEVVYFNANRDANGNMFNSSENNYSLSLTVDQIPPADYFWSITIYDQDNFLVDNEIGRYSLGDRSDSLAYGEDGSLTIYIQNENPGEEFESNWLPAPSSGSFLISVRIYGPAESVLSREFELPGIQINN